MKPKLCYILSTYDSNISSHYRHNYELLAEAGKKIDIYLLLERSTSPHPPIANLTNIYIQKISWRPFNLIERFFVLFLIRLQGYRVFYVHYSTFSSIVASLVCNLTAGKSLFWHCQSRHRYEKPFELKWTSLKAKLFEDWPFRLNLKLVDHLVTCTNEMRAYYEKHFNFPKTRSIHFPLWVNLDRFHKDAMLRRNLRKKLGLQRKTVILFVHWLSERKGADKIIPVANIVIRKFPKARFLILGEGPLLSSLKAQSSRIDLGQKIIFTGAIPNEKVPNYYNVADVFFMPIKENGFGRVLLEAMAYGLPAVATDSLGPKELWSGLQRKFLVPFDDVEGFSKAILRIINNPEVLTKLSKENDALVKDFSLTKAVTNLEKIAKSA